MRFLDAGRLSFAMGGWRLLLATLVAASHLWEAMTPGYAAYAVWAFFVLSGFLMTHVLKTSYGFTTKGTAAYMYNRVLRIFPAYYVALAAGVVTLNIASRHGMEVTILNPQFAMPSGWNWLNPLSLLSIFPAAQLPVPVSNALALEVTAYLLMPLLAGSASAAALAATLSATFTLGYLGLGVTSFADRYALFLPCILAFAWGSLTWYCKEHLKVLRAPLLSMLIWLIHGALWQWFSLWPWTYGLYVSLPLSSWVVISLFTAPGNKVDRWLGDLSYPVYLFHTTVGAWLLPLLGFKRSFALFVASFIVTIAVAALVVALIEKPLARLKRGHRASKAASSAPRRPDVPNVGLISASEASRP